MPLTTPRDVDHFVDQELRSQPVAAAQVIHKGAFVGLSPTGFARPLQAGDPFAGIAYESVDNLIGIDGDLYVRIYSIGDFALPLPSAGREHIGRPVFANDDESLTLNAPGNTCVGTIRDRLNANEVLLRIDTFGKADSSITHAVEDLGPGADIPPRAMYTFDRNAWIIAARVINQNQAATGINNSNSCHVVIATSAGPIAEINFNTTTPFPNPNGHVNVPLVTDGRVFSRDTITLAVTNQPTANPGSFIVAVDHA